MQGTPHSMPWIPVYVNGTWIPDSLSFIPDSKVQDSEFQKQNFLRFQLSQAKYFQDSGIWIPLYGAKSLVLVILLFFVFKKNIASLLNGYDIFR